ncbi:MAG: hypothetical protein KJN89_05665 [Gammaproteobacteria bacterium]|nr:hypothetical protein [Gammaproteobacteria bacterium]MBT8132909.1 hypothetical protein [Gammaproteobacteria bacterium]NNJ49842.1 hypothetical protein [Gammaproteobacteria bacterium]
MENAASQADSLASFTIPIIMLLIFGIVAHMLAKEKGRNVVLWTVLGFIPVINVFCMWFFVGAANLRLEKKIDQLLEKTQK